MSALESLTGRRRAGAGRQPRQEQAGVATGAGPSARAAASRSPEAPAPTGELSRDRLCDMVEGLAHEPRADAIQAPLDAAVEAWQQLAATDDTPSLLQTRFDAAAAAARARLEQLRADAAAAQAEAEARAAKDARRAEVCQQLEDYVGRRHRGCGHRCAGGVGRRSMPSTSPGSDAVNQRFLAAIARQRARLAARLADAERHAQLATIAEEAEQLAGVEDLPTRTSAGPICSSAGRRSHRMARPSIRCSSRASRRPKARSRRGPRRFASRKVPRAPRTSSARSTSCDRLEAIAARENLPLKDADQALRDARSTAEQLGALPSRDDQAAIVERLKKVQARLMDVVRDLRSADDWKRWANATVQQELCEKVEGAGAGRGAARRRQAAQGPAAGLEAGQCRAARRRGRRAVAAVQGRRRCRAGARRHVLCAALRRGRRRAAGEGAAGRAGRGAGRIDRLAQDRRRAQGAPAAMECARPRAARRAGQGAEQPLPRRLRSLLHAPQGRPHAAQGRVERQPGGEGGSHRPGRSHCRDDRLERRRREDQGAAGRSGRRAGRSSGRSPSSCGRSSAPPATASSSATRTVMPRSSTAGA